MSWFLRIAGLAWALLGISVLTGSALAFPTQVLACFGMAAFMLSASYSRREGGDDDQA